MITFVSSLRLSLVSVLALSLLLACSGDPIKKRSRHMERGDTYFEKQEYKKAIIEYQNVVQIEPRCAAGHYQLALAYLKINKPELAFVEFSRTVDLDRDNLDAQLKLGQLYLMVKKLEAADKLAVDLLKKDPGNVEALFLRTVVMMQEEKFSEAILALRQIINLDEKNAKAYVLLGLAAVRQRKFQQAQEYLEQAVKIRPEDPSLRIELARVWEEMGKYEEAESEIKQAIVLDLNNAELLGELGNYYARHSDYKSAETAYIKMALMQRNAVGPKLRLGKFYAAQREWQKALHWAREAKELQPENAVILNALASLYIDVGKTGEAKKLIDDVLSRDRGNLHGRFLQGLLLLREGRLEEAGPAFDAVIADQPDYGDAHYQRALVHLSKRNLVGAKSSLLKAIDFKPENLKAGILLAEIYLSEGALDLSLEQLEKVVRKESTNYRAWLLMGKVHSLKGDADGARLAYQKAAEINADDPAAHYGLAILDRDQGNYGAAANNLKKVLDLQNDHAPAMAAMVSLLMASKQQAKALSFIEEKLKEHENNRRLSAVLHEMRGTVFLAQEDYGQAENELRKALAINQDSLSAYLSLAKLYLTKKDTTRAVTEYLNILEKQPRFVQGYMALGTIYDSKGDTAKAREMYENALNIDSDFAPAANNLAWTLLQRDTDLDRAFELAKKAKARLPDDPRVGDTLGFALIKKGLYPSAISELRESVTGMEQDPTVLYHLGLAYWKNDEQGKALAALRQSLQNNRKFPELEEARKLIETIEEANRTKKSLTHRVPGEVISSSK